MEGRKTLVWTTILHSKLKLATFGSLNQSPAVFVLKGIGNCFHPMSESATLPQHFVHKLHDTHHTGHKFHEVFQQKNGGLIDMPPSKVAEIMKSNSIEARPFFLR